MCSLNVEEIYVLLLNNMNRVIDHVKISSGGLTASTLDVRVVLREALMKRATAMALCHNHPSGNTKPSRDDDHVTVSLAAACKIMNIRFLDHLILTTNGFFSYNDEGRL